MQCLPMRAMPKSGSASSIPFRDGLDDVAAVCLKFDPDEPPEGFDDLLFARVRAGPATVIFRLAIGSEFQAGLVSVQSWARRSVGHWLVAGRVRLANHDRAVRQGGSLSSAF